MPLYTYECESCGHKFEAMIAKEGEAVKCPKCGSAQCTKSAGGSCSVKSSPKRRG